MSALNAANVRRNMATNIALLSVGSRCVVVFVLLFVVPSSIQQGTLLLHAYTMQFVRIYICTVSSFQIQRSMYRPTRHIEQTNTNLAVRADSQVIKVF